jgi:hypothetical protein
MLFLPSSSLPLFAPTLPEVQSPEGDPAFPGHHFGQYESSLPELAGARTCAWIYMIC